MSRLREKTTATLLLALILASMTAIAVPVHAGTYIDHTEDWTPFALRSQDVEDSSGDVSVVISNLEVSEYRYVGYPLTLSGTVEMTANPGIHGWWIHSAWSCTYGYAALAHGGGYVYYEESPFKWAYGERNSGWWWNIIPNDQSQTYDFTFDYTPTEAGPYSLKAGGHADAGYWRQHYDSEHYGWSWKKGENNDDSEIFQVVELYATGVVVFLRDTAGVLNKGQANSLLVKIEKGLSIPFEDQVRSLCQEGVLTTAIRDWLLYVEFN